MSKRSKSYNHPNKVKLQPNKYKTLDANLAAEGVDIRKLPKQLQPKTLDTRNKVIKSIVKTQSDFYELLNNNNPTQIPYLNTTQGNLLVNPSTVSVATLQKVAQNEVVARCLDMNVTSIYNSLGKVYHSDPKIQQFLRDMYKESNGGLRRIVENICTDDVFGHSVNYMRDRIDENGYTKLKQLDLLPPSTILYSATPEGDIENIFMYLYSYQYANTQNLFSYPFIPSSDGGINYVGENVDPWASYGNADGVLRTNVVNTMGLIVLDKDKAVHSTSDKMIKIANPYGYNPLTRRVFDLVNLYDMYKSLQTTFLSYKASPLLVAYAHENRTVDGLDGQQYKALNALYTEMQNINFNGALLLSGLKGQIYEVEAINTEGDTKAFENALDWYAKQIEKCLGLFSNEDQSYASATTQTSFYGRLIQYKKEKVSELICNTINRRYIELNFGTQIKDYGYFENVVQNLDDQMKMQKIFTEETSTGIFAPGVLKSDNDYARTQLKQPVLTDKEFAKLQEWYKEQNITKPNDNSARTNSGEAKEHYKKGAAGEL